MKAQQIRTIWNSEINIDDWKDFIKEEYSDYTNECFLYERCSEMNYEYLGDEKMNLNKQLNNNIIILADLGLWNGRKSAYKIVDTNLNSIFDIGNFDDAHWYADRHNIRCTEHHHDGTNYYLFREFKKPEYKEIVCSKQYNGTLTSKDITRYTRSLRPYVTEIYVWKEV